MRQTGERHPATAARPVLVDISAHFRPDVGKGASRRLEWHSDPPAQRPWQVPWRKRRLPTDAARVRTGAGGYGRSTQNCIAIHDLPPKLSL